MICIIHSFQSLFMRIEPYRLCLLALVFFFMSCKKDNESINAATPSILEYIAKEPSLSLLNTAIGITRLDTVMSSGGPFTFFTPNDPAFLAAGLTADSIKRMDPHVLLNILRYNVVNGRLSSNDVPGFLKQQFTGLHPLYSPFITKNYYGIFLNGIPVAKGNITLGDGIVNITTRLAIPPAGSQLEVINQEKDLTFFAALVRNVHTLNVLVADPNPNSSYLGTSNATPRQTSSFGNTLLAPTDSAFRAYGYQDTTALINDSLNVVNGWYCYTCTTFQQLPLLQYYILNGFNFTSDLKGPFPIGNNNTPTGVTFRYGSGSLATTLDGFSFTGNGIPQDNPVRIIKPDIIATNGVVQKINQVFLIH
jgi:uncharacterized surface protein with fasciclin (FAS1) repeats